jgi:hypothetical protein
MNPLTETKYNIYEAPIWENCESVGLKSRIDTQIENPLTYQIIYNKDLFFIEKYISDEIAKFTENIYLVKMCDEYGMMKGINKELEMPEECRKRFKNFEKDTNVPQVKMSSFVDNPFMSISYSDAYIETQKNMNDKKNMCQRYADLNQMLEDYTRIIKSFDTPEIKSSFKDDYDDIIKKHGDNLERRKDLNTKISDFYQNEGSRLGNSKLHLDSTVYTSVLWTIAATTLLFYIFRKL